MSKPLTTAIQIFLLRPQICQASHSIIACVDFVWCVCDANSRFSATLIGSSVLKFLYDFL